MQIRVAKDSVEISGYVNAIERKSKPLWTRMGRFVERIRKGAFKRALERNDNVRILLNHNPERDLGGTKDGNLKLEEDNIGLHARAVITDPEVIEKARKGELVGWSFGFSDRDVDEKRDEDGYPMRDVNDLDLAEVSILDKTKNPAYEGTLVSVRSDDTALLFAEIFEDEIEIREEKNDVPKQQETVEKDKRLDEFKKLVEDMKKEEE